MAEISEPVREQYVAPDQQGEADYLGMWIFLASEAMLFGAIFLSITVYRVIYPEATHEASGHLYMTIGGLNTAVLLTSSMTMAMAVAAAEQGRRRDALIDLVLTAGLGTVFLAIKLTEYYLEYREGLMPGVGPPFPLQQVGAQMFFHLYFTATGLHAIHLLIGICVVGRVTWNLWIHGLRLPRRHIVIDIVGMYWHLIDLVWVFLYPLLYLPGGRDLP
jgi:cytochrome c oxidase subunit 3